MDGTEKMVADSGKTTSLGAPQKPVWLWQQACIRLGSHAEVSLESLSLYALHHIGIHSGLSSEPIFNLIKMLFHMGLC